MVRPCERDPHKWTWLSGDELHQQCQCCAWGTFTRQACLGIPLCDACARHFPQEFRHVYAGDTLKTAYRILINYTYIHNNYSDAYPAFADIYQHPPRPRSAVAQTATWTQDPAVRSKHLYVIGKTGTGKTTLIKRLILRDIEVGRGCGFIDPHGDAASDLIAHIPPERLDDVIYFAPASFPAAFNPLALPYRADKLAGDITSFFKLLFPSAWGARLEQL